MDDPDTTAEILLACPQCGSTASLLYHTSRVVDVFSTFAIDGTQLLIVDDDVANTVIRNQENHGLTCSNCDVPIKLPQLLHHPKIPTPPSSRPFFKPTATPEEPA